MSKRISFQGVDGAYSQLAVKDFFSGAETLPCKTFEIALNEAELGNVDYAMIPIENSAAGRVADIHRLIPKSNLHINFEHFQKVEHKLLIHPDSKIENIKNILSHEQALAQCSDKIQKLDLNILIGADTAGSAKTISDEKILDTAAIASSLAGKTYGLKVGIIRCGNIFGPADYNLDRLVPGIIVNTLKNKKTIIRSSGKLIRDYIYVQDAARAYLILMKKMITKKLTAFPMLEPFFVSCEQM